MVGGHHSMTYGIRKPENLNYAETTSLDDRTVSLGYIIHHWEESTFRNRSLSHYKKMLVGPLLSS